MGRYAGSISDFDERQHGTVGYLINQNNELVDKYNYQKAVNDEFEVVIKEMIDCNSILYNHITTLHELLIVICDNPDSMTSEEIVDIKKMVESFKITVYNVEVNNE